MFNCKNNKWATYDANQLLAIYQQTKDKNALAELICRYSTTMFAVCMKYLGNEEDAKDIFQDAYIKVELYFPATFKKSFENWLFTIVRNLCLSKLYKKVEQPLLPIPPEINYADETDDIKIEIEKDYVKLEDCMKTIKDTHKMVIELFHLKSNCYKQIAQELKEEVGTIRNLLQNGRISLLKCIEQNQ